MGQPYFADYTDLFGRVPEHDVRSEQFLMRTVMAAEPAVVLPKSKTYRRGPILNQSDHPVNPSCNGRDHGHCVGFAGRAWQSADLMRTLKSGPDGVTSWWEAQARDQWEGQDPTWGTSGLGLMKYYQDIGIVEAYYWTWTVDAMREWMLSGRGGILIGVPWDTSMMEPDAEGIIRVNGREAGGHEVFVYQADDRRGWFGIQNSWGDWGPLHGVARLPYDDMHALLRRDGDAVAAIQKRPS